MLRKAQITFHSHNWIGGHDGYRVETSAQLWVEKDRVLTAETLGGIRSAIELFSYEVQVERIVEDRVSFTYRNLVVANPGGGLNLSAPNSGRVILRRGESVKLGTPVFDGGANLTLTLDEIR